MSACILNPQQLRDFKYLYVYQHSHGIYYAHNGNTLQNDSTMTLKQLPKALLPAGQDISGTHHWIFITSILTVNMKKDKRLRCPSSKRLAMLTSSFLEYWIMRATAQQCLIIQHFPPTVNLIYHWEHHCNFVMFRKHNVKWKILRLKP